MNGISLPPEAKDVLLIDAVKRDRTTARRVCLLKILYQERHLTREQLVARVESELGKGCFGGSAWKDTFSRDMRLIKRALQEAGYSLVYRRNLNQPGYEIRNEPAINNDLKRIMDGSISEVDPAQIAVIRHLLPEDRFRLGCSISDTARNAVAYRIQQRDPALSLSEASRLALSKKQEN